MSNINFNNLYSRLKTFKRRSIASIVVSILFFIVVCICIVFMSSMNSQTPDEIIDSGSTLSSEQMYYFIISIVLIVISIIFFAFIITIFVTSIQILLLDVPESLNTNKILWGILSLLILGSIGTLIYSVVTKRKLEKIEEEQNKEAIVKEVANNKIESNELQTENL